jgi:type I restriction enzyme R subunit
MAGAIDWVLTLQQEEAAKESSEEGKKQAHRRYADAVLALSKAFALGAASDEALDIRDEVGFFQMIRAALVKSTATGERSAAERELAIQQIVSRAVVSTEIVDIMKAAGIESPDISILSDEFLAEVRDMGTKNLAIEALRKLINGEVRSQARRNVTQSRAFSERLEAAIARYHANAITTVQVLEELIGLAQDIRAAHERGEETGLSDEEIAFYDALAENNSAQDVMGEPALRVIAHELVTSLRSSVTVDWMHRDAARARMRVLVKRILRKYGYPPDLQDAAVQTVLQQAEALSAEWAKPAYAGSRRRWKRRYSTIFQYDRPLPPARNGVRGGRRATPLHNRGQGGMVAPYQGTFNLTRIGEHSILGLGRCGLSRKAPCAFFGKSIRTQRSR